MLTGTAADERKWAEAVRVIYPDAARQGSYANISGMALAKYAPDRDNAVKLMDFLASREAQQLYAKTTLEYPVAAGTQPADVVKTFGTLKTDDVALSDVIKYHDQASQLVDKVGFDDGPGE
jgi:iron(III) transport system substrate-binding protein